jgi:hypothetical protein
MHNVGSADAILAHFLQNEIIMYVSINKENVNSVALVRERTLPIERPPPVGEVSANFCG